MCSIAAPLRHPPPPPHPPSMFYFFFFLSASYKELFKPWYRHTEQAFILGQRERGGWGASVTLETRELTDSRATPATSFFLCWSKALSIFCSFLSTAAAQKTSNRDQQVRQCCMMILTTPRRVTGPTCYVRCETFRSFLSVRKVFFVIGPVINRIASALEQFVFWEPCLTLSTSSMTLTWAVGWSLSLWIL